MTDTDPTALSADAWDGQHSPRPDTQEFDRVVERAISRRGFLGGALAFGSCAAAMGTSVLQAPAARAQSTSRFAFDAIPIATDNTVHVPDGYRWDVLARWGDPLFSDAGEFDQARRGPERADRAFGENCDGMEHFSIGGRDVLAVNHEYANARVNLLPAGQQPKSRPDSAHDVAILQAVQGVSVMEIAQGPEGWRVVVDSPFNRRIDHTTPMHLSGPAAGHDLLKTAADPSGTASLGTFNNCGADKTPWGTYLTCEENFNGYFGATGEMPAGEAILAGYRRYGIRAEGYFGYEPFDARFDVSHNPHEPHRAGYVVEIDPANPQSVPVKRTALGRFKHENAETVLACDGRVVVYMGDDEKGEFLYKWVSRDIYVPGGDTSTLLEEGQLHAARFNDDLTGEWLPLTPQATGMSPAEIAIFTRIAASRVGATTMDRPEWVAVSPVAAEAYCALTNNIQRGVAPNLGGDAQPARGPNPRVANRYGQIVRWRPEGGDHAAGSFAWDLYVMAGNPLVHGDEYAGSDNVTPDSLFNSPDGMQVDTTGLVWIQTDGNDSNAGEYRGMGNNQMLAGDPETGEIRRFLTGPQGCEVTGLCWSADRRTLFVGIQHPDAPFPDGEGLLPRSAVVAIRRDDNAPVG